MSKIPLREQFAYPTLREDHDTGKWDTAIGRRNKLVTTEAILAGLCANPALFDEDGCISLDDMVTIALNLTELMYDGIE